MIFHIVITDNHGFMEVVDVKADNLLQAGVIAENKYTEEHKNEEKEEGE